MQMPATFKGSTISVNPFSGSLSRFVMLAMMGISALNKSIKKSRRIYKAGIISWQIAAAKIDAVCKDGILTIMLPKTEKAKAVKVKIKEQ